MSKIPALVIALLLVVLAGSTVAADQNGIKAKAADTAQTTIPAYEEFSEFDEFPILKEQAVPIYPESASKVGKEGKVLLKLRVNTVGKVDSVVVVNPKPATADLELAAVTAAKQWEFKPVSQNGKPVTIWVAQSIVFKMGTGKKK